MKTIKTSAGVRKINTDDADFVSLELRYLLQEHRSILIEKMISGGLDSYVTYKFNSRLMGKRLQQVTHKLSELKSSGIDMEMYRPILEAVLRHEHTTIGNAMFYEEIDKAISVLIAQPDLFSGEAEGRRSFLN